MNDGDQALALTRVPRSTLREAGTTGNVLKKVLGFISSPLGLLLLGTLIASVLIPRWSAIWQDRQPELALKTALADKVAQATSETVHEERPLVKRAKQTGDVDPARYDALRTRWLIRRAQLQAVITTYFSDSVAGCWFRFSNQITNYVSIPPPRKSSQDSVDRLRHYLQDERKDCRSLKDMPSYLQRRYRQLMTSVQRNWTNLSNNPIHTAVYDDLGELLLIERERVMQTLIASNAKGFAHGWWIFR